ncbi:hypothetical protein CgunFtcFv8_017812 [Champsocephalus gunnari]|uniref:Uncharacterized protein n=1 Tax=Champsocephalus gunnari TaxID=52237 RepID=A0AAN8DTI7_CHAGU|nr:hypothetical protein CgunFtcFv8_017812 [Champsocephalus gunnari]
MQCYPVWSSSKGTRGELLQTEPIWSLPPWDSLSCGRVGHINLFTTAATSTAQPARHLLNKSASACGPGQKEYGRDLAQRREMREWGEKKVGEQSESGRGEMCRRVKYGCSLR